MNAVTASKAHSRGPVIQIPQDLSDEMDGFAKRTGLKKAAIARAALASTVPRLLRGELAIVNGELRPA